MKYCLTVPAICFDGVKVAVVGPHAVSQSGLLSDYAGDMQCADGKAANSICTIVAEESASVPFQHLH